MESTIEVREIAAPRRAPMTWLAALDAAAERREDEDAAPVGLEDEDGEQLPAINHPAWRAVACYHRRLGTARTTTLVGRLWLLVLA